MSVLLGDGLVVSDQGFGGMALADVYGQADRAESLATLHHAIDAGVTFLDTADIYGDGSNETLLGEVLRTRRDEVVLATKFGITERDEEGLRSRGDPAYVRSAIQASLHRLSVERIDLYYYHRVDPRVPIEETIGALAELVREGLVAHVGVSEVTGIELERANAVHPIAAVQSEWSVWSRDVEDHVVPTATRHGIGFVAYSPLGRGFLAAPLDDLGPDDLRRNFPRFDDERITANRAIAAAVRSVAEAEGATPAQVALAWLYERGRRLGVAVVPIPGTRKAARIDENSAAVDLRLGEESIAVLDGLASTVVGDRARDARWISQGRERDS
ncbi:MAG TPA: aldo/keto reductase [Marisediminicola sp.]|jgi:aryl-alcohol dehydrogenase-like predicted oxidoreductase|nr:aldo/keto reductase [Cryobacterium sp.]HEV7955556.1 aldo/keto reductase [Marisediminicola sp.]